MYMKNIIILTVIGLLAAPREFKYDSKTYYVVSGNDETLNTGNKVCEMVGKTCVGYTNTDIGVCKKVHPRAKEITGVNGSKTAFYCNGAPQKGVACETNLDTCQICPACNVNADCSTAIGDQYAEMYVECEGGESTPPGDSWMRKLIESLRNTFIQLGQRLKQIRVVKTVQVEVPGGSFDERIGVHPDQVVCEFYQTPEANKKHVTCGAYKAADTFCAQVMGSRFAKALKCDDQGLVVCGNPCTPPEYQLELKQCAFDGARARGNQAAPIRFCQTTTTQLPETTTGLKTAGQECKHGGECAAGNCLGQPSDSGIKYFCSCNPFKLDYSCNK